MMDYELLDEETRFLYHSALEIKRSKYFQTVLAELDKEVFLSQERCRQAVMGGDFRKARYEAAKVDAYNWLLQVVEKPINDAEMELGKADQPEESYVA